MRVLGCKYANVVIHFYFSDWFTLKKLFWGKRTLEEFFIFFRSSTHMRFELKTVKKIHSDPICNFCSKSSSFMPYTFSFILVFQEKLHSSLEWYALCIKASGGKFSLFTKDLVKDLLCVKATHIRGLRNVIVISALVFLWLLWWNET